MEKEIDESCLDSLSLDASAGTTKALLNSERTGAVQPVPSPLGRIS